MIGIFDSGVGGLTVTKDILNEFPSHDILYFADLARSPYGTKSKEAIKKFSTNITKFLISKGAKIIIIACNTASAQSYNKLKTDFSVPIFDVITPVVEEAVKSTRNRKIGIIGTIGTIKSKAYNKAFKDIDFNGSVFSKACPLFVPLVEEKFHKRPETKKIARFYLRDLKNKGIDTLILGCTHYPLIKDTIQHSIGRKVNLIDSSSVARKVSLRIEKDKKLADSLSKKGRQLYFTSDMLNNFQEIAEKFLERKVTKPFLSNLE